MPSVHKPVRIFISSAPEDKILRDTLVKHLNLLKRYGTISHWHVNDVQPGINLYEEVSRHLSNADIILLLISPDFMSSDFCYHVEMQNALQRHTREGIPVVPILLRPTADWRSAPFWHLKIQPSTEEAITDWSDQDKAFVDVVSGIKNVVEGLRTTFLIRSESLIWNVPYNRNPFFVGREIYLEKLYTKFFGGDIKGKLILQALCGLGGIGKTQIAVEYVYRYCDSYKVVLWIRAESRDVLISEFRKLSVLLGVAEAREYLMVSTSSPSLKTYSSGLAIPTQIPFHVEGHRESNSLSALSLYDDAWTSQSKSENISKSVSDESNLIQAVKEWFRHHSNWLVIFDNVDNMSILNDFLPLAKEGHILLTTQSQAIVGIAESMKIEKMEADESVTLLLHRSGSEKSDISSSNHSSPIYTIARDLIELMGGNPLALDQAGAYIEETGCGLSGYLSRYKERRAELLKTRVPGHSYIDPNNHPDSIATTLLLCFEKLQNDAQDNKINKAATEMLQLFAFLDSEQIPEKIITTGASNFRIPLQEIAINALSLDKAIIALRRFSLIERNPDIGALTIHRLVKAILQDKMDKKTKRRWAAYAIKAVSRTVSLASTEELYLYSIHIQMCIALIEEYNLVFSEAALLLHYAGVSYKEQTNYEHAEMLLQRALDIYEKVSGTEHLDTISSLDDLAVVYYKQGKYKQAEPLLQRALLIRERFLGSEHPDILSTLDNLTELYYKLGKYSSAIPLCQRALSIRESKQWFDENLETVNTLNSLAELYYATAEYEQAMSLFQRVLETREQIYGLEHPEVAQSLNNLGILHRILSKYEESEALFQRALTIWENREGNDHPDRASTLDSLARLYYIQDKYELAEAYFQQSLETRERILGLEHPETTQSLNNLAILYRAQGKFQDAETLFLKSLNIRERVFDAAHPDIAQSLNNLGVLYRIQSRYDQAEEHFSKALRIYEVSLGVEHPSYASVLNELAILYRSKGVYDLARQVSQQSLSIREKLLGSEHPNTAQCYVTLASIYRKQGEYTQAEKLLLQARTIYEKVLGSEHSNTASSIDSLGILYFERRQYSQQAERLFLQALDIRKKVLGLKHLDTARSFNNLAVLYESQHQYDRADDFYGYALEIYEEILGREHLETVAIRRKYTDILRKSVLKDIN